MSTEEAWAVGLFEGEGCISVEKRCHSAFLQLKTTDPDVLDRLQKIWGGRVNIAHMSPSNIKQPYVWKLQNKPVVRELLIRILPLLGERRACKALDAIDRIDRC